MTASCVGLISAWFQKHDLPVPGAIGIFSASAGGIGQGDSGYSWPLTARKPPAPNHSAPAVGYFEGVDLKDPMVSTVYSAEMLAKFPPTLVLTGTRDMAMSSAVYTHAQLVKAGVDAGALTGPTLIQMTRLAVEAGAERVLVSVILSQLPIDEEIFFRSLNTLKVSSPNWDGAPGDQSTLPGFLGTEPKEKHYRTPNITVYPNPAKGILTLSISPPRNLPSIQLLNSTSNIADDQTTAAPIYNIKIANNTPIGKSLSKLIMTDSSLRHHVLRV